MRIDYVAYISGKEIVRVELAQGVLPEDGSVDENGHTRILVPSIEPFNGPSDFMERQYYDNGFVGRGGRPSMIHDWNTDTTEWEVNPTAYQTMVRSQKQQRLVLTDWSVLPDVDLTEEEKAEAVAYRAAVRAVESTYSDTVELPLVFPAPPAFLDVPVNHDELPYTTGGA